MEKENIIFGVRPVIEAINAGKEIDKLYIQRDIKGSGLSELRNAVKKAKIAFTWNHCKIGLIKTKENYYVIEGSGNYSENEEVEQYIFENLKESYYFDYDNLLQRLLIRATQGKRTEILK